MTRKQSATQMALFTAPSPQVGWAPDVPLIHMQWLAIKRQDPGALIFLHLGDFYEVFGADARTAVRVLGITSTEIPWVDGERTPMAGVPCQAIQGHIDALTARGYRVILVDQMAESEARP